MGPGPQGSRRTGRPRLPVGRGRGLCRARRRVSYTDDAEIQNGRKFLAEGMQIAAGVPLQVGEGADFRTFRIGLFGLEKWHNVERSVAHLSRALEAIGSH